MIVVNFIVVYFFSGGEEEEEEVRREENGGESGPYRREQQQAYIQGKPFGLNTPPDPIRLRPITTTTTRSDRQAPPSY